MIFLRSLTFFALAFAQSLSTLAQLELNRIIRNDYVKFKNYSKTDGLCSYLFTDMIQDGYGFMWFATEDGLIRFDGHQFKTYQGGSSPGQLPHNYVSSLAIDSNKNLWVGTKNGLCIYRPKTDSFERIDSAFGEPLKGHQWVRDIYFDSKGRLWIDRHNGTLNCIDFNKKTVKFLLHYYKFNEIYPFHAITEFSDGVMIGGGSTELIRIDPGSGSWQTSFLKADTANHRKLKTSSIANLYDDGKSVWVANFADYSYRIDKKSLEVSVLPLRSVYTICPNGDGLIWMGGYHFGAVLYNPVNNTATRYLRNEGNPESLADNMIRFIYRDRQGNVWFGTNNGLSMLSAKAHSSIHLRKLADLNSLPSNQISCMLPVYPKQIWMGTQNKGLVCYDNATKRITRFGYADCPDSIGSNWVTSIAPSKNNSLLITLWNGHGGALNRFWLDKKMFQRFDADQYYWYTHVVSTSDGKALVGSWGINLKEFDPLLNSYTNRLYTIYGQQNSKSVYNHDNNNIIASGNGWMFNGISLWSSERCFVFTPINELKLQVHNFGVEPQQTLWLKAPIRQSVFYKNNLYLLLSDGKIYPVNLKNKKNLNPVPSKLTFTQLFAGKHLYAANPSAVYRWNERNNSFEQILKLQNLPQVKAITDNDSTIFIGTTQGLYTIKHHDRLSRIDSVEVNALMVHKNLILAATTSGLLTINSSSKKTRHLSEQVITCLTVDSAENVWFSNSENFYRLSLSNQKVSSIKPCPTSKDSLPSSQVKSLATDAGGDVWIVSDKCVTKYIASEQRFESYYSPGSKAIQSRLIYRLFEDSQGFVWVGYSSTGLGVDRINRKNHTIEHFPHLPYDSTSYPLTSATYCIFEDANGNMLFGTDKGLAILPPDQRGFTLINQTNGLPSTIVTAVNQDRLGNYWIGTDKGVFRYSKKLKRVDLTGKQIDLQDGLITSIVQWGFDTLIVAGDHGVNIFNPYNQGDDIPLEKIKIISCITDYDTVLNFPENQTLFLRTNHKWLEIGFSATDYTSPGKIAYTYWLEGFEDSGKAQVTTSQFARYTNLPFGKYTFKVYYSRPDGSVSHELATLSVIVGLPFYLRPWFFLVFLALTALSVYLYEIRRVRRIKRNRDELEKAVTEKTKEILMQNEELKLQAEVIGQQSESLKLKTYQINEGLEFAKSLQLSFMPSSAEAEAILRSAFVMYKPKDTVSGDFYWLKGDCDGFILIVADCTGHGVHGGFVSMMGLTLLNELYNHHKLINPSELIVEMHEHLMQIIGFELLRHNSNTAIGLELAVCCVNRKSGIARYASTHFPLYQLTRTNGSNAEILLHRSGGKPVGSKWFVPNIPQVELSIKPGDILLFTTDGIFDQLSFTHKKRFGRKQFEEVLMENPFDTVQSIGTRMESRLEAWQGKSAQTDDITLIGFEV